LLFNQPQLREAAGPSEMLVPNYSHTPELIFTHECGNL